MTVAAEPRTTVPRAPVPRLALILGSLSALGPLSIDLYLPALPELGRDLHSDASAVQLTLTACLVGLALGQAAVGPPSDRYGRRLPLRIGVVAYTLGSLLCVAAPSLPLLIAARLLQGLAGGAAIVIARAVVRDLYEGAAAARLFAALTQISGIAPVLSPLAGGLLLHVMPWRGLFVVIAIAGAVLVAAIWRLPETASAPSTAPMLRTVAAVARDRDFTRYMLAGGLSFAAMFAYIAGSPFVLQDLHGLSELQFAVVFAVNGTGIILTGLLAARQDRFGPRVLLAAGLALSAAGGLLILATVLCGFGLWPLLAGFFAVVSSIGLTMSNSVALALDRCEPATAGTASALLGLSQFVIGGLAAPLAGLGASTDALALAVTIAALTAAAPLALARRPTAL
ncbi:multidrug effflux MFS transporter [Embleya sp. NPDC005575]|uniref:multidrug effflux MFS transporter n=1 Tax=Embleya sp. NPDC005575 TaxID=3156892 RepID=UPI0033A116D1